MRSTYCFNFEFFGKVIFHLVHDLVGHHIGARRPKQLIYSYVVINVEFGKDPLVLELLLPLYQRLERINNLNLIEVLLLLDHLLRRISPDSDVLHDG